MHECFVIFEGGGAKGITHLGALKALQEKNVARIGAAGTSAGAIIAALTAVGYGPDELFTATGENILSRRGKTPIDLLGAADWRQFRRLRTTRVEPPSAVALNRPATVFTTWLKLLVGLASLIPSIVFIYLFSASRTSGRPLVGNAIWRMIDVFGFFSTEPARDILNELLLAKVTENGGLPKRDLVCFRDIAPMKGRPYCPLKLIATNLGTRSLQVFDGSNSDVVVADAVAASFSIPFFFKPTTIRTVSMDGETVGILPAQYADGGLVSNLPVWVFNEVKRAIERVTPYDRQRPIQIVAFTLEEAARPQRPADQHPFALVGAYAAKVLQTGIFGGQTIVRDIITHLTVVSLPTNLGVVQFDCSRKDAITAYASGRNAAETSLDALFVTNPTERCRIMTDILAQAANHSTRVQGQGVDADAFRCCLVRRLGNRAFKVIFGVNMTDDADDDLVLDEQNPGAPTAYRDRDFTFVDVATPQATLRMTKYERALVRKTLSSVISVPIFAHKAHWNADPRPEPLGVFCIDSDRDLSREYADETFLSMLAEATVPLASYMSDR